MGSATRTRLAAYGNVRMPRGPCGKCGELALVIDGHSACCDHASTDHPEYLEQMAASQMVRKRPSAAAQEKILRIQGNCCIYCGDRFGAHVWRRSKRCRIKREWDHMVPFSYSGDNSPENFVAACAVCNQIKSDRVFQSVEEAQAMISPMREQKGYPPCKDLAW